MKKIINHNSRFKVWLEEKLGKPIRIIDLARNLGETRGEIVRKWYAGETYPSGKSITNLAEYLQMPETEIKKEIMLMKLKDLES